jgi:hypothetical protein
MKTRPTNSLSEGLPGELFLVFLIELGLGRCHGLREAILCVICQATADNSVLHRDMHP